MELSICQFLKSLGLKHLLEILDREQVSSPGHSGCNMQCLFVSCYNGWSNRIIEVKVHLNMTCQYVLSPMVMESPESRSPEIPNWFKNMSLTHFLLWNLQVSCWAKSVSVYSVWGCTSLRVWITSFSNQVSYLGELFFYGFVLTTTAQRMKRHIEKKTN